LNRAIDIRAEDNDQRILDLRLPHVLFRTNWSAVHDSIASRKFSLTPNDRTGKGVLEERSEKRLGESQAWHYESEEQMKEMIDYVCHHN